MNNADLRELARLRESRREKQRNSVAGNVANTAAAASSSASIAGVTANASAYITSTDGSSSASNITSINSTSSRVNSHSSMRREWGSNSNGMPDSISGAVSAGAASSTIQSDADLARALQQEELSGLVAMAGVSGGGGMVTMAPPVDGKHHRMSPMRHFTNPAALYRNTRHDSSSSAASASAGSHDVSFSDITSGPVQSALVTVGMVDGVRFIREALPQGTPVTYIRAATPGQDDYALPCSAADTRHQWEAGTFVFASMTVKAGDLNKRGTFHPKLHLLRYASHLRVMICSANQCHTEWGGGFVGQIVWCFDVPKHGDRLGGGSSSSSSSRNSSRRSALHPFAQSLSLLLQKLLESAAKSPFLAHQRLAHSWIDAVEKDFDFSVCGPHVHLVTSRPGVHYFSDYRNNGGSSNGSSSSSSSSGAGGGSSNGDDDTGRQETLGVFRLLDVIRKEHPRGYFRSRDGAHQNGSNSSNSGNGNSNSSNKNSSRKRSGCPTAFVTASSMHSSHKKRKLQNGKQGKISAGTHHAVADRVEMQVSSVSCYTFDFHNAMRHATSGGYGHGELSVDDVCLVHPSTQRVEGRTEYNGEMPMACYAYTDEQSWKGKSRPVGPLRGCLQDCSDAHDRRKREGLVKHCPCLIFELAPSDPNRALMTQHSKIMLRESTVVGPNHGRGWIYAGSHNLSMSAWGGCKKSFWKGLPRGEVRHRCRINSWEVGVLLTNVRISDFPIPWTRPLLEDIHRYNPNTDAPYPMKPGSESKKVEKAMWRLGGGGGP